MKISKKVHAALPFDLADAVKKHAVAQAMHALTVDQPAPTAHPLVEAIVSDGSGFELVDEDETAAPDAPSRFESLEQQIQTLGEQMVTMQKSFQASLEQIALQQALLSQNYTAHAEMHDAAIKSVHKLYESLRDAKPDLPA